MQSPDSAALARAEVLSTGLVADGDQIVVGTCHLGLLNTALGWPGTRLVVQSGKDGADLALLDVLESENLAARFDGVVLVSGDGIFRDAVLKLAHQGVHVQLISRAASCSKDLRMAVRETTLLADAMATLGGVA